MKHVQYYRNNVGIITMTLVTLLIYLFLMLCIFPFWIQGLHEFDSTLLAMKDLHFMFNYILHFISHAYDKASRVQHHSHF